MSTDKKHDVFSKWEHPMRQPEIKVHDGDEIEYELRGIVTIRVRSNVDLDRVMLDENFYRLKVEGSASKSAIEHIQKEIHVEAKIPFELEKMAEVNEGWEIGVEEVEWEWDSTYEDNPFVDSLPI